MFGICDSEKSNFESMWTALQVENECLSYVDAVTIQSANSSDDPYWWYELRGV